MMQRFAVILAGGGGTRFWPLSRQNMPKQLLNLSGNDVMINETIRRYEGVISSQNTFIVVGQSQKQLLDQVLPAAINRGNILVEPIGRNTAPGILYAAMHIYERFGDGIMCVFPSDHYISDLAEFGRVLESAADAAEESSGLITIGIKPVFPAIGYGYIQCGARMSSRHGFAVSRFVEKPDIGKAKEYVESGDYFWNSGMFAWKLSVIIEAFKRFLPRIYRSLQKIEGHFGTAEEARLLRDIYPGLDSISVDYGVLERTDEAYVIPGYFGWNDVGSWDALGSIFSSDENGNIVKAQHVGLDTRGCIVYGNGKLIATIGLENMVVVETEDALLICPKARSQEVKRLVELLKEAGRTELV